MGRKQATAVVDVAFKVAEQQAEREISTKMAARMTASSKDIGHVDGLRFTILTHVMHENYQRAIDDLEEYIGSKDDYPQFRVRCENMGSYCVDLINGVKAKRSFPGMQFLSMSRQQELLDRAMEHFEELKRVLHRIERIENEVRLDDVRSTVWVVRATTVCVAAVLILAFCLEMSKGVLPTVYIVVDDTLTHAVNFIFSKLGL